MARRSDAERTEKEEKGLVKPKEETGEDTDMQKFERAWITTGIARVTREGMCPVILCGRGRERRKHVQEE